MILHENYNIAEFCHIYLIASVKFDASNNFGIHKRNMTIQLMSAFKIPNSTEKTKKKKWKRTKGKEMTIALEE